MEEKFNELDEKEKLERVCNKCLDFHYSCCQYDVKKETPGINTGILIRKLNDEEFKKLYDDAKLILNDLKNYYYSLQFRTFIEKYYQLAEKYKKPKIIKKQKSIIKNEKST